jgi:tetratricopeptide (TPR) repeat protein
MKSVLTLLLLISLAGCYAGTVKPFVDRPEFKAENEPVRTLRILMLTDGSYRKDEIEELVSKCSRIMEKQVGIRLEIVDSQEIQWGDARNDSRRMLTKIATETWEKTDHFDLAVAFAYFDEKPEPDKLYIGRIDGVFWRYVVVKELEPNLFLHELFHALLPGKEHGHDWLMKPVRSPYGSEWYWLTPEERREVLGNKWRNFNSVPAAGEDKKGTNKESGFQYFIGLDHLRRKEYPQAVSSFEKSVEADPEYPSARMTLARLLAMTEKRGLRNGKKAVELALKACELTEWKKPIYLDTLAAAYARTGDFEQAVKWQKKAIEGMKSFDQSFRREAQGRLRSYRNRKPVPPD